MKRLYQIWLLAVVALFSFTAAEGKGLSKVAKKQIEEKYEKGKFLVVVKRMQLLHQSNDSYNIASSLPFPTVILHSFGIFDPTNPDIVPLGTVFRTRQKIWILNKNPYRTKLLVDEPDRGFISLTCEIPLRHSSSERRFASLVFPFDTKLIDSSDLDAINAEMDGHVALFATFEEAEVFAGRLKKLTATAKEESKDPKALQEKLSGQLRSIYLGMTFAQFEREHGAPETIEILDTGRMIYKYKIMDVEFVDGKVIDVRMKVF